MSCHWCRENSGCEAPTDSYGTDPEPPHAAEVIGELAALRAEVAGLRAELSVLREMHYDELKLKKNVWDRFELLDTRINGVDVRLSDNDDDISYLKSLV